MYILYCCGGTATPFKFIEENVGGGAMSITFFVCPYFFCSSGSEADV